MKLLAISRRRPLTINIIMSVASAVAGAYMFMCAYWLCTGMRYGLKDCMNVWLKSYLVLFVALTVMSVVFFFDRKKRLGDLAHRLKFYGCDDEYMRMLNDYMGEEIDASQSLIFASCCLECGQYADCRKALEKINFKRLSSSEQDEYFNIYLFSAILDGDAELANDIYRKARHYFDRAVQSRRNGFVLHTLGMLCYINGRLENAYRLFNSAMRENSDSLRCECCIGMGLVFLASGDKEGAKEMCFAAAELAQTRSHALRLRELMIKVENAYRAAQ